MNFMQNVRRIGLVGLVLVGSSVSAFADNIIKWDAQSSTATPKVAVTASNTSGFGGGAGTEISVTHSQLVNPVNQNNATIAGAPVFLTFDLKSTDLDSGGTGKIIQDFQGSFTITDNSGNVLVTSSDIYANVNQQTGRSTLTLNTGFNTDPTGSLVTGTTVSPYGYVAPFFLDINLNVSGLAKTGVSGGNTLTYTANSGTLAGGDVQGQPGSAPSPVPEPSTFALLGLGAAAMAFGAYRRRAAV